MNDLVAQRGGGWDFLAVVALVGAVGLALMAQAGGVDPHLHLAVALTATALSIVLTDGASFPSGGGVVRSMGLLPGSVAPAGWARDRPPLAPLPLAPGRQGVYPGVGGAECPVP